MDRAVKCDCAIRPDPEETATAHAKRKWPVLRDWDASTLISDPKRPCASRPLAEVGAIEISPERKGSPLARAGSGDIPAVIALASHGRSIMNFFEAVSSGFRNYVNFSGRAIRSEYWYWTLFVTIVVGVLGVIDGAFLPGEHGWAASAWRT